MHEESLLFVNGTEGYRAFDIPVLLTTEGALLAFAEGRNGPTGYMGGDAGDIDIVLKRSLDGGKSWEPLSVVVRTGTDTDGNPAPVLDRETGTIWLLFCRNFGDRGEDLIIEGKAPRTVWITSSRDNGETWDAPSEITESVKDPGWTWYATGPAQGIQLESGRLVVPCDHVLGSGAGYHDIDTSIAVLAELGHAHVVYSDDHGASWHIGGIAPAGTNESQVVETSDGSLYFNCRNYVGERRRAYSWSNDGGVSFHDHGWDESLPEPICQAGMIRFTDEKRHDKNRVLFSNPASNSHRERMTVRISYDECRTWSAGKLLHEDHAAYSNFCIASDMSIYCLYVSGSGRTYDGLALAHFDLEWLTDGADSLRL